MPIIWWQHVANLWNKVINSGAVLEQWAKAKVILLWKKPGKPVRCLWSPAFGEPVPRNVAGLKTSCGSWATCFDTAGLPRMSVSGALMQLQLGINSGVGLTAQQDIATFFDSIHLDIVEAVLQHLHAPPALMPLLRSSYSRSHRMFVLDGAQGGHWHSQSVGLAQGCPFSPCVAAAITHCWGAFVTFTAVQGFGYLDNLWIIAL